MLDTTKPLRLAFFRFQNCPIVLVASSSHSRSASNAMSSTALKNFTAFGAGRGRRGGAAPPRLPFLCQYNHNCIEKGENEQLYAGDFDQPSAVFIGSILMSKNLISLC